MNWRFAAAVVLILGSSAFGQATQPATSIDLSSYDLPTLRIMATQWYSAANNMKRKLDAAEKENRALEKRMSDSQGMLKVLSGALGKGSSGNELIEPKAVITGKMLISVDRLSITKISRWDGTVLYSTPKPVLLISVVVLNMDDAKKKDFITWRLYDIYKKNNVGILRDDVGNTYDPILLDDRLMPEAPIAQAIYPWKGICDQMAFEIPVDKAKTLTLAIQSANLELPGYMQFFIPTAAIKKDQAENGGKNQQSANNSR
jgi:hypothetical protein